MKLVAFGSTIRKGVKACGDAQIRALVESRAPTLCIFSKYHKWQVTDITRASPQENLDMIQDSLSYLTSLGLRVFIDLEYFFYRYKQNKWYALKCCRVVSELGAKALVLCDTNGDGISWKLHEITEGVCTLYPMVTLGVHCYNDSDMAVANLVMAVKAGAGMVQGTMNGIWGHMGSVDLCSIVPSLALHVHTSMVCKPNISGITALSRFVGKTLNCSPDSLTPYVGSSACTHKGGFHLATMKHSPMSYQHIDPSSVRNKKIVLISELSCRHDILGKIR